MHRLLSWLLAALALVAPGAIGAQTIHCESRNYQRAYCPTGPISGAQIVTQISAAPCAQGRTWGWDGGGIWVSDGCEGQFAVQPTTVPPPEPPPSNTVGCESRDYQQSNCPTAARISRAWIVQQHSQAPCIEGRTWGWDERGVWVNQGCSAVFGYQAAGAASPAVSSPAVSSPALSSPAVSSPAVSSPAGSIICESVGYRQSWCGGGRPLRRVWLAEQRSQAPCIEGQTWGWDERSVWVNGGCAAVFSFE